jgi:hypothetical protein
MVTRRQFPLPDTPLTQQCWNANELHQSSACRIAVPGGAEGLKRPNLH